MNKGAAVGIALVVWFLAEQFQAAARRISADQARALVQVVNAEMFGAWFRPADVLAVIEIESGFDPEASRWEARRGEASLGLMQLLLSTARDRGWQYGPAGLFDPLTNIRLGMAQMRWNFDYLTGVLGGSPGDAQWIGAYNAGVGNVKKGLIPTRYVAKWVKAREKYI